jgi:hypothetical protein
MKPVLSFLAIAAASGCAAVESVGSGPSISSSDPTAIQLEQPLLTFEVVPMLSVGVAEEVAGDLRILRQSEGWIPLLRGTEVGGGAKLQFGVGARLRIRFASGERAELKSPDKERWVVFELAAQR